MTHTETMQIKNYIKITDKAVLTLMEKLFPDRLWSS